MDDKENAAQRPVSARAPGDAPSWMKGTASSMQRVTADAGSSQQQGLAGTLRPNPSTPATRRSHTRSDAREANSTALQARWGRRRPRGDILVFGPLAQDVGVADLNSFRARLNVVKRESMMRQSLAMPFEQDTTGADRLGAPRAGRGGLTRLGSDVDRADRGEPTCAFPCPSPDLSPPPRST